MRKRRTVNAVLKDAIVYLERQGRKNKAPVWRAASSLLSRGSASRVEVNVNRLSRLIESSSSSKKKNKNMSGGGSESQPIFFFVPGKVLGTGTVGSQLVVGAYTFSSAAKKKIEAAGGEAVGVEEFLKRYPDGTGVVLVT